jgi:hypothetical protein
MSGVVMVIRESALQETLAELQDVITKNEILLRIMPDAEFEMWLEYEIKIEDSQIEDTSVEPPLNPT